MTWDDLRRNLDTFNDNAGDDWPPDEEEQDNPEELERIYQEWLAEEAERGRNDEELPF